MCPSVKCGEGGFDMAKHLALKGGQPIRRTPFSSWPVFGDREEQLLLDVLRSGIWSFNGPREKEFAQRFAEYTGASEVLCVSNGSVSLEIALRALGIGPGDEVIVPALTWTATALAPLLVGATPVFADVAEADWCLDPQSVRECLTPRTRALIPVHLYSQVAPMDELQAIAQKAGLAIVEDCAHAHGSKWRGKHVGLLGQVGSFSCQQSKSLTSGEGGILITQDAALAEKMQGWKNCGRPWKEGAAHTFGGNYRLTEFQAAILLGQLERLPDQLATRNRNVALFEQLMRQATAFSFLPWKEAVTQRGMYGLSLRYRAEQMNDVPREVLIRALRAEGVPINPPYEVVYRAANWIPGKQLLRVEPQADPATLLGLEAHAPAAEAIAYREGLVIPHQLFLGSQRDMEDLAAAFEKVQRYADELMMDTLKHTARGFLRKIGI